MVNACSMPHPFHLEASLYICVHFFRVASSQQLKVSVSKVTLKQYEDLNSDLSEIRKAGKQDIQGISCFAFYFLLLLFFFFIYFLFYFIFFLFYYFFVIIFIFYVCILF